MKCSNPSPLLPPDPLQQELAALVKHRGHLLQQITQNNNLAETISDKKLLAVIARNVAFLQKQIEELKALIAAKIKASPTLQTKVQRLQLIQGVGSLTASALIALMPELGTMSDGQAAALAGLAPFNRDSGQFRGHRQIAGGQKNVRSTLYMAALVASRYNPILQPLYRRLIAAGKAKK